MQADLDPHSPQNISMVGNGKTWINTLKRELWSVAMEINASSRSIDKNQPMQNVTEK